MSQVGSGIVQLALEQGWEFTALPDDANLLQHITRDMDGNFMQ